MKGSSAMDVRVLIKAVLVGMVLPGGKPRGDDNAADGRLVSV